MSGRPRTAIGTYGTIRVKRKRVSSHVARTRYRDVAVCIELATRIGLGSLNVLVLLCFWNATKFVWMAVLSLPLMLNPVLRKFHALHV